MKYAIYSKQQEFNQTLTGLKKITKNYIKKLKLTFLKHNGKRTL